MTLDKVPRKITYEYETLQETCPRKKTNSLQCSIKEKIKLFIQKKLCKVLKIII